MEYCCHTCDGSAKSSDSSLDRIQNSLVCLLGYQLRSLQTQHRKFLAKLSIFLWLIFRSVAFFTSTSSDFTDWTRHTFSSMFQIDKETYIQKDFFLEKLSFREWEFRYFQVKGQFVIFLPYHQILQFVPPLFPFIIITALSLYLEGLSSIVWNLEKKSILELYMYRFPVRRYNINI